MAALSTPPSSGGHQIAGSLRRAQQRLRIAPLIQELGLLAPGLLEMGVLDVAVALDVRGHRGELEGKRMIGRAEAAYKLGDQRLVVGDQTAFLLALLRVSDKIDLAA